MKRILVPLLLTILAVGSMPVKAQDSSTLFPYPKVPENVAMSLTERCNYMIYNFWDKCNIKESFSSMNKLNDAFDFWVSFMPYASADTVHMSIDKFISSVNKSAPKEIVKIGQMARGCVYSDTAHVYSEELYEPFCEAVVKSKKASKTDKTLFQAELQQIQSSALGKNVPGIELIKPDGVKMSLDDVLASRIILFFNDPDCFDCRMAKIRLSADFNTKELVNLGLIKIVSIYPGDVTEEWIEEAKSYPEGWVVVAAPDADLYFNLNDTPSFYYLDGRHKVLGKNFDIDSLLYTLAGIYQSSIMSPRISEDSGEVEVEQDILND